MTAEEKLKEIEKTCETWKILRGLGFKTSDDSWTLMEKAADGILKIIKENK